MRQKVPEGWHSVTPRIAVDDVEGLIMFLKQTFDAAGEYQPDRPAVITIGDSQIMISGTEVRGHRPAFLYVYVEDTDATYKRAIEAGATSLEEPKDLHYGDRRCMVEDRWGNVWQIATPIIVH